MVMAVPFSRLTAIRTLQCRLNFSNSENRLTGSSRTIPNSLRLPLDSSQSSEIVLTSSELLPTSFETILPDFYPELFPIHSLFRCAHTLSVGSATYLATSFGAQSISCCESSPYVSGMNFNFTWRVQVSDVYR